jgi:hypothetical protein
MGAGARDRNPLSRWGLLSGARAAIRAARRRPLSALRVDQFQKPAIVADADDTAGGVFLRRRDFSAESVGSQMHGVRDEMAGSRSRFIR